MLLLGRTWMGKVQRLRLASVPQQLVRGGQGQDPGEGSVMADLRVAFLVSDRM